MTYWLHHDAEVELGDAAAYYAKHASKNIAGAFFDEFERLIALLQENQGLGTPKAEGMRVYSVVSLVPSWP